MCIGILFYLDAYKPYYLAGSESARHPACTPPPHPQGTVPITGIWVARAALGGKSMANYNLHDKFGHKTKVSKIKTINESSRFYPFDAETVILFVSTSTRSQL